MRPALPPPRARGRSRTPARREAGNRRTEWRDRRRGRGRAPPDRHGSPRAGRFLSCGTPSPEGYYPFLRRISARDASTSAPANIASPVPPSVGIAPAGGVPPPSAVGLGVGGAVSGGVGVLEGDGVGVGLEPGGTTTCTTPFMKVP